LTTKIWEFKAVDTLFFRDGTPYNAGEGGGLGIKSIFPPYIFTLQGAVFAPAPNVIRAASSHSITFEQSFTYFCFLGTMKKINF
jgi:hypothetical protein